MAESSRAVKAERCPNPKCNCQGTDERGYCSDFCQWFHARLIRHRTSVEVPEQVLPKDLDQLMLERELLLTLNPRAHVPRLKCACGHGPCAGYH
jgi:hypothetical protein